jgi:hypothetical protein
MSEYHKIETLYERDDVTHKLKEPLVLKNRVYGIIKTFDWTEKIDGTSMRVIWDHKLEKVTFGGRTDNANIDAQLFNWMLDKFPLGKFKEIFPAADVVLYGEGCGAGIQKGGIYSQHKQFVMFDCLVIDEQAKWWLSRENTEDVAGKFDVLSAPYIGEMTLEAATASVRIGFTTKFGNCGGPAEGLIGRPVEALFDKKGARVIVKLKTKDFAPIAVEKGSATVL